MKFAVLTNPGLDNNLVEELLISGLRPKIIVSNSPLNCKNTGILKYIIKKIILLIKYFTNQKFLIRQYQPYFLAKKHSILFFDSSNVNSIEFESKLKKIGVDYIFTFGFRILKQNIIDVPLKGCINFHPALLPFNRGATPSKWVILNKKNKTGITFHFINKDIDAGSIIEQYEIPLSGYENSKLLNQFLFGIGAVLFVQLIFRLKLDLGIKNIENDLKTGSYQKPFMKKDRVLSENNTKNEIDRILRASRGRKINSIYSYNGKEIEIINSIVIDQKSFGTKELPFMDLEENIYIETKDNNMILLVSKKKV